jgi:hypothetical protein
VARPNSRDGPIWRDNDARSVFERRRTTVCWRRQVSRRFKGIVNDPEIEKIAATFTLDEGAPLVATNAPVLGNCEVSDGSDPKTLIDHAWSVCTVANTLNLYTLNLRWGGLVSATSRRYKAGLAAYLQPIASIFWQATMFPFCVGMLGVSIKKGMNLRSTAGSKRGAFAGARARNRFCGLLPVGAKPDSEENGSRASRTMRHGRGSSTVHDPDSQPRHSCQVIALCVGVAHANA